MQRPYTDADLRAYSGEHLWYEVWMFFEMVDLLTAQPQGAAGQFHTTGMPVAATNAPTMVSTAVFQPGMMNSIAPPPGSSISPSVVRANASVECFMAHLRTLVEFLSSKVTDPTDVVASDFCTGAWTPVISQPLRDSRIRVNKELAHLTTMRLSGTPSRKQWDVTTVAQEVRDLLNQFVAAADPARLSPRVNGAIK